MNEHAETTFVVKRWDEEPYDEVDAGPKLTRVSIAKTFEGDLVGKSTIEYLMMHRPDGTATFVGLERFIGSVFGKDGTFVSEHVGTFQDGTATTQWRVLSGSGTGALSGLRGAGSFALEHAEKYSVTFEFELD